MTEFNFVQKEKKDKIIIEQKVSALIDAVEELSEKICNITSIVEGKLNETRSQLNALNNQINSLNSRLYLLEHPQNIPKSPIINSKEIKQTSIPRSEDTRGNILKELKDLFNKKGYADSEE